MSNVLDKNLKAMVRKYKTVKEVAGFSLPIQINTKVIKLLHNISQPFLCPHLLRKDTLKLSTNGNQNTFST